MKNDQVIDGRRRTLFRAGAVFGAVPWFGACSGGGGADPAASAPAAPAGASAPPVVVGPPPVQATITGAYRFGQTYLFQSIGVAKYSSTLGGSDFSTDSWGPTYKYVDIDSGWAWANPGGDWIDAALVPQGSAPWASFGADAVSGSNAVHTYSGVDATAMVKYCQQNKRWLAVIVRATGAPRAMAGTFSTLGPPPSLAVTYADGSAATLKCRMVGASTSSSTLPLTTRDSTSLPCFMEFDQPAGPVASATLAITVTEHWSGSAATIELYLCNPPINAQPVTGTAGLASQAGAQDVGIAAVSGVIGAQRYVDGSALTDFAIPGPASHTSEMYYDPALWGGKSDLTKWPHTAVGKWINVPANLTLVTSSYTADGFVPLVPGMGALKLVMPDGGIQTGQEVGYTGTGASDMKLFMPFDDMGLLDHIFVRHYFRLGAPQLRTPADRREVRQSGVPKWSNMDGKFGIAPSHTTTYGGTSGSSGGGIGWQMRHYWAECEAAQGGPDEAGLIPGWHLYDFQTSNPPGYRYGYEGQNQNNWGQQGGLGSVLYAGRWYCVETEIKLNSVNPTDNTFTPDGLLRTWIDGHLVFERTGMVFRTLPIYAPAYDGTLIRPFRQLGIKDLWWNWYNGGTTQSTVNRTQFVTALVWARQRIGVMK